MNPIRSIFPLVFTLLAISSCGKKIQVKQDTNWPCYGGDEGGSRYSPLDQINRTNVKKLKIAWTFRTGEDPMGAQGYTLSECTPITHEEFLYLVTPLNRVIALDAAEGTPIWTFDPHVPNQHYANGPTCRGVSLWIPPTSENHSALIFVGTNDGRLIALDAKTGKPFESFGLGGTIDLKAGMGERGEGNYQVTSPPAILGDLVIVGSAINDNWFQKEASGVVRAYSVRTGELKWSWDPIPQDPKDPAYLTWGDESALQTGAANAWAPLSVDSKRDLVFIPTSSPSVDYYGGQRPGQNVYANSIVALRGSTGELVWFYQTVHHDIWDYDLPAQPSLIDLNWEGETIPALCQPTKMGFLFLLNRETGKPLFPIEERTVPQEAVPGEKPWPTQPFPLVLEPLVPHTLQKEEVWGIDSASKKWAEERFESLHYAGMYTPPSLQGTLVYPGNIGGVAWGGVAIDKQKACVIANTNRLAAVIQLIPRDQKDSAAEDEKAGKAPKRELQTVEEAAMYGTPYTLSRSYFVTPEGVPATPPPWGALSTLNLKTGKKSWEVPLGKLSALSSHPNADQWGSLNYGGPVVTAGGLIFIAATMDNTLRAFDKETGALLWHHPLPAGAQATPMTYFLARTGKQYVVINAGGHGRLKTTPGDYFIAFTLE